ncbi:MAG: hypothetical protein KH216_09075, partial [Clostridiales bacterium]|nr:hypothetical protein [Clostridiales bacterium]
PQIKRRKMKETQGKGRFGNGKSCPYVNIQQSISESLFSLYAQSPRFLYACMADFLVCPTPPNGVGHCFVNKGGQ